MDSGILTRWDSAQFARMAFELGGYGVLACVHIMHLDCWVLYEDYERGRQAPQHLTECSNCNAKF